MLNTKVVKVAEEKDGIRVTFEGNVAEKEQVFDRVLVSIGRRPNSKIPGLETTKVKVDAKGFIESDPQRRTAEPSIFVIGDVAGEPMLAHKASHEGRVAVEAIAGHKAVFEPQAIPAVVFTDPEIAWCGYTEAQAKEKGLDVDIAKFPWGASGRAISIDRPDGLTKLIVEKKTGRILGVGLGQPRPCDLGIREHDRWNRRWLEHRLVAGNRLDCDAGLVRCLVRQHRLARHVPDGEDGGLLGAPLKVGLNEAAIGHLHARLLESGNACVGTAPDRHEECRHAGTHAPGYSDRLFGI